MSGDNFKYLSQEFSEELVELLKQKGFYFYVYLESWPSNEKSRNSLTDKLISEKVCEHIGKTWRAFKAKTMTENPSL